MLLVRINHLLQDFFAKKGLILTYLTKFLLIFYNGFSDKKDRGRLKNLPRYFYVYSFISGSPAVLVSSDTSPASSAAETTVFQSTPEKTAPVPIVATAVCATVLIALIPAALSHFKNFCTVFPLFDIYFYAVDFLSYNSGVAVVKIVSVISGYKGQPTI